jgi:hypothetical protein
MPPPSVPNPGRFPLELPPPPPPHTWKRYCLPRYGFSPEAGPYQVFLRPTPSCAAP